MTTRRRVQRSTCSHLHDSQNEWCQKNYSQSFLSGPADHGGKPVVPVADSGNRPGGCRSNLGLCRVSQLRVSRHMSPVQERNVDPALSSEEDPSKATGRDAQRAPVTRLLAYPLNYLAGWQHGYRSLGLSRGRMGGSAHEAPRAACWRFLYWLDLEPESYRPCGTSAFQLISPFLSKLQRRREVSRKGRWIASGKECTHARIPKKPSLALSLCAFFFFKWRSTPGRTHACNTRLKYCRRHYLV